MDKKIKNTKDADENENCLTGECPPLVEIKETRTVKLSEGSGGAEMQRLISEMKSYLPKTNWQGSDEDSAYTKFTGDRLVFTTDSYVVTPVFFPGGNIGKIAFCGTVNDLAVMGATPLGISLGLVIEEGFDKENLFQIINTIGEMSKQTGIPVVTGDTKVMERGSIDGIIINTSGVGETKEVINAPLKSGDKIIVSGGIGEHGAALLAKRFELQTSIESDSKPLYEEISAVKGMIKKARDITRGGLAAVLNEIAEKQKKQFEIIEEHVPLKKEVRALTEILGIDVYSLACEGRFVCFCSADKSEEVLKNLKKFNPLSAIIGEVKEGKQVIVQTRFGKKILSMPSGNIVPRIC